MAAPAKKTLSDAEKTEIRAHFNKHDKDGNGFIDKKELEAVLSETLHRSIPPTLMQKYVAMHFHKHDKDGNELIDFDEFCGVYSQLFVDPELPVSMKAKEGTSKVVLETGDNAPKHDKKVIAISDELRAEADAEFEKADKDKSGHISKDELLDVLKGTMGKKMSEKMIERFVDAQFQLGDANDDGQIDRDEFATLWARLTAQQSPAGTPKVGFGIPPMM